MDQIKTALEIKAVALPERIISGYAAVIGNEDKVRDIIDPGAFTKTLAEKSPSDVAVFIGHNVTGLPMGIPQVIRVDQKGLYTETLIKPGPMGDDLLQTAAFLHDHGLPLGMSIGYRRIKSQPERKAGGGYVQRLMEVDLREYSYAAAQTIANPEALTVGVKTGESDEEKAAVGSFDWTRGKVQAQLCEDTGHSCYVAEMFSDRVVFRSYGMAGPDGPEDQLYQATYSIDGDEVTLGDPVAVDVQYVPMPKSAGKTEEEGKATMPYHVRKDGSKWCVFDQAGKNRGCSDTEELAAAHMRALYAHEPSSPKKEGKTVDLPDSAYLYIEEGGQRDDEGKTVPRTLRHYPFRDAEGKIDVPGVRVAIATIPHSEVKGLNREALEARAERLLENALGTNSGKTLPLDEDQWTAGVALEVSGVGYELRKIAEDIAEEQAAQRRLGEDTKQYRRIRPESRARIQAVIDQLQKQLEWAETIDAGAEQSAVLDRYQRELDLIRI